MNIIETLDQLAAAGNLRNIPEERRSDNLIDFSTNDYLGFGSLSINDMLPQNPELLSTPMTSSASRLLAATQNEYEDFEYMLEALYHRPALMFNSGYHANTGIVGAVADRSTLILADKLVHASIIDGMILSRAKFKRFPHNDLNALEDLIKKNREGVSRILVIVESVYSMDGDSPDLEKLIEIKKLYPEVLLYVDEAHAFGVCGPHGLGKTMETSNPQAFDIVVATLGKALASFGAFAIVSADMKKFLINRSRSLIFSTSLPPLQAEWSRLMVRKMLVADNCRNILHAHSSLLYEAIAANAPTPPAAMSHIQALIVGDSNKAVELSGKLKERGVLVLPIRTPTVPAGTERLRFSLSASISPADMLKLSEVLSSVL